MNIQTLSRSARTLTTIAVAACGGLSAQQLISYLPATGGGTFFEECLPSAACGAAGVPVFRSFAGPSRPVVGVLDGAVAVDDRAGVIYSTNGFTMIARNHVPRLGCVPVGTIPSLPIPAAIGSVRGMAVDPTSKHLFLSNGSTIFTVDPLAGMAITASFPSGFALQITGLAFDPTVPGELLAVSLAADVIRYSTGGVILGVTPAAYPLPASEAVGLAQDRSSAAGGDVFVLHANGEIFDHRSGAFLRMLTPGRVGIAFAPHALRLPGAVSCAGVTAEPRISALAFAGSTGFGLDLCGIPAGTPFAVALIGIPAIGAPVAALPSGLLWVGGAPIALGVPVPAGSSALSIPLSLAGIPPSAAFDVQWGIPCAVAPSGHVLTDGLQIEVGR